MGGLGRIWNNSCSQNRLQESRGRHRLSTVIQPLHQNAGEVVDLTVDEDGKDILYSVETFISLFLFCFYAYFKAIFHLFLFLNYQQNIQLLFCICNFCFFRVSCFNFQHCFCISLHTLTVVCGSLTKSLNDERLQNTLCIIQIGRFVLVLSNI